LAVDFSRANPIAYVASQTSNCIYAADTTVANQQLSNFAPFYQDNAGLIFTALAVVGGASTSVASTLFMASATTAAGAANVVLSNLTLSVNGLTTLTTPAVNPMYSSANWDWPDGIVVSPTQNLIYVMDGGYNHGYIPSEPPFTQTGSIFACNTTFGSNTQVTTVYANTTVFLRGGLQLTQDLSTVFFTASNYIDQVVVFPSLVRQPPVIQFPSSSSAAPRSSSAGSSSRFSSSVASSSVTSAPLPTSAPATSPLPTSAAAAQTSPLRSSSVFSSSATSAAQTSAVVTPTSAVVTPTSAVVTPTSAPATSALQTSPVVAPTSRLVTSAALTSTLAPTTTPPTSPATSTPVTTPTSSSSPFSPPSSSSSSGLSGGAIAGIVIGVIVAVFLCCLAAWCLIMVPMKGKQKREKGSDPDKVAVGDAVLESGQAESSRHQGEYASDHGEEDGETDETKEADQAEGKTRHGGDGGVELQSMQA